MRNNSKNIKGNKVIKAAVLGGLVGGVAGLLLAPKNGRELRQDLAIEVHELGDKAIVIREMAQGAWQNLEDKTQVTVDAGKTLLEKGKRMAGNLRILVHEIQNGALNKTNAVYTSEEWVSNDPTVEIMIIENEHEY